jgi:hypothetical protein
VILNSACGALGVRGFALRNRVAGVALAGGFD